MDDRTRWQLTKAREQSADGVFVYGVRTTKIFCRPTCPARLARQANITFFDHPSHAEKAGFRACKRCRPELATYEPDAEMVKVVCEELDKLPPSAPVPALEALAKAAGLTEAHFHRKFKRATGLTPKAFGVVYQHRRSSGCGEALTPAKSEDSMADSGYETPARLGHADRDKAASAVEMLPLDSALCYWPIGPDPEEYAAAATVYYDAVYTSIGLLSIAFHASQIVHLQLVADEMEHLASLFMAFPTPGYQLEDLREGSFCGEDGLRQQVTAIAKAVECPSGQILDLPLSDQLRSEWTNPSEA